MKIGIDIRPLMDREYSGVSWCALELIREILRLDKANDYWLFYNSGRDIKKRMPEFPGAKLIAARYPNKFFNYFLQKILHCPKIDRFSPGTDIFFSPHINFTALSRETKSVLLIHDLSFLRYPDFFSRRKNFWHHSLDLKKLLGRADKIVAVSENTRQDLKEFFPVSAGKTEVIPSGLSEKFKKLDNNDRALAETRAKFHLPARFILFLSTIEPRKNLAGTLRSFDRALDFAELNGFELVVAGRLGWKEKEFRESFDNLKHKDKVRFLGYVSDEEKICLYNLASVFVYPSFYEGFGFPPLEAMACGTPVIAGANSSILETAGDAAILVEAENIESLAQAMRQLCGSPDLRKRMIERGLARVKQFSISETARKYIELFKEFTKKSS